MNSYRQLQLQCVQGSLMNIASACVCRVFSVSLLALCETAGRGADGSGLENVSCGHVYNFPEAKMISEQAYRIYFSRSRVTDQ